ncbi:hypothetical protein S40293_10976 [Stachybotrys chartarum IBT 40293]|nr:hypothetical protein S40293_10976 [Stachybotrys chartarum IBT 40293]
MCGHDPPSGDDSPIPPHQMPSGGEEVASDARSFPRQRRQQYYVCHPPSHPDHVPRPTKGEAAKRLRDTVSPPDDEKNRQAKPITPCLTRRLGKAMDHLVLSSRVENQQRILMQGNGWHSSGN